MSWGFIVLPSLLFAPRCLPLELLISKGSMEPLTIFTRMGRLAFNWVPQGSCFNCRYWHRLWLQLFNRPWKLPLSLWSYRSEGAYVALGFSSAHYAPPGCPSWVCFSASEQRAGKGSMRSWRYLPVGALESGVTAALSKTKQQNKNYSGLTQCCF